MFNIMDRATWDVNLCSALSVCQAVAQTVCLTGKSKHKYWQVRTFNFVAVPLAVTSKISSVVSRVMGSLTDCDSYNKGMR